MIIHRPFIRILSIVLYSLIIFAFGLAFLPFKDVAAQGKRPKATPRPGLVEPASSPAGGPQSIPARISIASLSAGNSFTCAVKNDGSLACWGLNTNGQATAPAGTFMQVSASVGGAHACAVNANGSVACWGLSTNGRTTPPSGTFTQVSAGGNFTCGVKTDGALAWWGLDENGRATPPSGTFLQVSAGLNHACAIRTDGALACWGLNDKHQAEPPSGTFSQISSGSNFSCAVASDNTLACWGDNTNHQTEAPITGAFSMVSAGEAHACALNSDGTLACWGLDTNGRATPPSGTFTLVSAGSNVTYGVKNDGTLAWWGENTYVLPDGRFNRRFLSAGHSHTCTLRSDGLLNCWGDNSYSQSSPPLETFLQISSGGAHTCGLKSDGYLTCWGYDGDGQTDVPDSLFNQVSAGDSHTCGVETGGTLACWGDNSYGKIDVSITDTFSQVSAGGQRTCALKTDNTIACWGFDSEVAPLTPPSGFFTQISSGAFHSCAIASNGTLACWGWNAYGQSTPPVGEFTQVSASFNFSCGLRSNGAVECWGRDDYRQISDVPSGAFAQISTGLQHVCGVKNDGTLFCWGNNVDGQAPVLAIYPSILQDGVKNSPYDQTLQGVNGASPYTFSIVSGSLPHNLSLSPSGQITGTPDILGTSNFTVRMTDANNFVTQQAFSMVVGIRIVPNLVVQLHADVADRLISTGAEIKAESVGTSVHGKATLSGTNGMPTGTVVFTSYANKTCVGNETPAGTVTLPSNGVAHPSLSAFVTGAGLSFTAHYSGDSKYIAVTGPCQVLEPIILQPTIITQIYDPLGNAITEAPAGMSAHARVSVTGNFVSPTGKITYNMYDNPACTGSPTQIGEPGDLFAGSAPSSEDVTQTSSGLSFITHYSGDLNYNSGDSQCAPLEFGKLTPTVSTHIHNPSHESVTTVPIASMVHDNVRVSGSYLPPTSTVTFTLYNRQEDCTGTFTTQTLSLLEDGTTESTAFRAPNTGLSYKVSYIGDINYYAASGDCQPLDVTKLDSVMDFTFHDAGHNVIASSPVGATVHASAALSGAADIPTGTLDFEVFSNLACTGAGTPAGSLTLDGSGLAHPSSEVVVPTSGISFKAHYSGDANYNVLNLACRPLKMPTVTTLTTSNNPSIVGKLVTFTITSTSPAGPVAGQVTLYLDGSPILLTLNASGVATYSTGLLAYGPHTLTASYAGNSTFLPSTSSELHQDISKLYLFMPVVIGN